MGGGALKTITIVNVGTLGKPHYDRPSFIAAACEKSLKLHNRKTTSASALQVNVATHPKEQEATKFALEFAQSQTHVSICIAMQRCNASQGRRSHEICA
jgi:predicted urease superfamily metal-dependent hydrolase